MHIGPDNQEKPKIFPIFPHQGIATLWEKAERNSRPLASKIPIHCPSYEKSSAQGKHPKQVVQLPGKPENVTNFDARRKSRGIFEKQEKSGKIREFCCVQFVFSQSEHSNFKNFMGEHAPGPPKSLGHTEELNRSLEKLGKSQGISSLLETGHPAKSPHIPPGTQQATPVVPILPLHSLKFASQELDRAASVSTKS